MVARSAMDVERLGGELGELLARHETGLDLTTFEPYADRPVAFQREVLGLEPWSKQVEIAESVRDNARTVVLGANGVGKDFQAASLALWWVYARRGLVLVTASAERTAGGVFMRREIAPQFQAVGEDTLKGELYAMRLDVPGSGGAGIEAMTSTAAAKIAGFHHGAGTLVILSEANDVPDFAWQAMAGNALGERDRFLALGNPLAPEGHFYKVSRAADWNMIRVPATEHPNIVEGREVIPGGPSVEWVKWMKSEWPDEYGSRVEGRFPEQAVDAAFIHDHRDVAVELHRSGAFENDVEHTRLVLAVDVAGTGVDPDRSALCVRQGPIIREFHTWRGLDTREVATRVKHEVRRLCNEVNGVASVYVDTVGPGGPGVYDRLREELRDVRYWYHSGRPGRRRVREASPSAVEYKASRKAVDPDRYANLKSQSFHHLRRLLERGEIAVPDDDGLWEELLAHRIRHRTDGRIEVGGKDDVRTRIGRSPDLADALTMTLTPDLKQAEGRRIRWKCF